MRTTRASLGNPLHRAFLVAGVQAGYPRTEDVNGFQHEGFGHYPMTVHQGRRWSSAKAYLAPVRQRANLTVLLRAQAERVRFENRRAVGVTFQRGGQLQDARAAREVILSGGPINDPQLLMLSGIGPAAQLRDHGLEVISDRSEVGESLMDQLLTSIQHHCLEPITLNGVMGPLSKLGIGLRWLLFRDGLGASSQFESGAFIRSRAGIEWADLQFHFLPIAIDDGGRRPHRDHGFQAQVGSMRSTSRGWVRLGSADPLDKPRIRFNYMPDPDDWLEMRASVRLAREIFAQPAFDPYRGEEIAPGADVVSDQALDAHLRDNLASS